MKRCHFLSLFLVLSPHVGAPKPPTPVLSEAGAFAVAEIRDSSVDALWAFYQDWSILRLHIKDATPFILINPTCFRTSPGTGLLYTINTRWSDFLGTYVLGPRDCSAANIGNVYDPTLACGPESGNPFCASVPPSSANLQAEGVYACNPSEYQAIPYTCQIGDLSGKYGSLALNVTSSVVTLPPTTGSSSQTPRPRSTPKVTSAIKSPVTHFNITWLDFLRGVGADPKIEEAGHTALFSPQSRPSRQSVQLSNGKDLVFRINRDPRATPVNELRGRSVSLQCVDHTRIACARIQVSDNIHFDTARNEVLTRLARQREETSDDEPGVDVSREELLRLFNSDEDAEGTTASSLIETLSSVFHASKFLGSDS